MKESLVRLWGMKSKPRALNILLLGVGWEFCHYTKVSVNFQGKIQIRFRPLIKSIFKPNHLISSASVRLTKHL